MEREARVRLVGDAIVQFDWSVGQIMETLDKLGLAENTLIILSSDNGDDSLNYKSAKLPVVQTEELVGLLNLFAEYGNSVGSDKCQNGCSIIAGSYFQQCFSKRERKDTCGIGKRYCREGSDY